MSDAVRNSVIASVRKHGVSIRSAADKAGVCDFTIRDAMKKDAEFSRAIASARAEWREEMLDEIRTGDPKAINGLTWILSRHDREQYGDKVTVEHEGGMTMQHGVIDTGALKAIQERQRLQLEGSTSERPSGGPE